MNKKLQKGTFETCLIFLISPFLSLPLILNQLRNGRHKYMDILISLLMGMISYIFTPSSGYDKVDYINDYFLYKTFSFNDFINFTFIETGRPDFIFYYTNFLFAKLNIDYNIFFFVLTTFVVYSFFLFVRKINILESKQKIFNYSLITLSLVLFGFSLQGLLSGFRFYFAASIFIWSLYYFFWENKKFKGLLFLILSIGTHFSISFFIPVIIFIHFISDKVNLKLLLAISLVFLFLPRDFLSAILDLVSIPENYASKKAAYIYGIRDDITISAVIEYHLKLAWLYFGYIYLVFINKEKSSKIYKVLISLIIFINITYSVPLVFGRYLSMLSLIFSGYLIYLKSNKLMKSVHFNIFFFLFAMSFIINIYVMRPSFIASFDVKYILTIVNVFSRKIEPTEFL